MTEVSEDVKQAHRRALVGVVTIGSVVAIVCALVGPGWLAQVGVGVAIATAVAGAVMALRFLAEVARENRDAVHLASRAHSDELRAQTQRHHDESMDTIQRFVARNRINQQTIDDLRNDLVATVGELTSLQVVQAGSVTEAAALRGRIDDLERAVALREQQILTVMAGDESSEGAELFLMPRRAQVSRRSDLPTASDIWAHGVTPIDIGMDMLPIIMDAPQHNVG